MNVVLQFTLLMIKINAALFLSSSNVAKNVRWKCWSTSSHTTHGERWSFHIT